MSTGGMGGWEVAEEGLGLEKETAMDLTFEGRCCWERVTSEEGVLGSETLTRG